MTKDEFMKIMGGIDEQLIDSALDIPRGKTVIEVPYERPPVLRYIMGFAACIAILAVVIAVRCFDGITTNPNDSAESYISETPDLIRGWNPDELVYGDLPVIGANVRVSVAELNGVTAELILHNVKKEAGMELTNELTGFEYTDYIGAEDIVLYVRGGGARFIETDITPHSFNGMELINANCLFGDSTRLFDTENGTVLMQYADYDSGHDTLIARFYTVDLESRTLRDENGIYSGGLKSGDVVGDGRIGGWRYGYQATRTFKFIGGSTFRDSLYGYDMRWNGNGKVVHRGIDIDSTFEVNDVSFYNITGWSVDDVAYAEDLQSVTSVIVASDSCNGITASLILHNVIKRPGERHYIYSDDKYLDMCAADGIFLHITDADGRRVLSRLPTPLADGPIQFIPGSCLAENCVRVLSVDDNGKERYIIRLYFTEEDVVPVASFIDCDIDLYTENAPKDENGVFLNDDLHFIDSSYVEEISLSEDYLDLVSW